MMKKTIVVLAVVVATMSLGSAVFASGLDVANCAKTDKGQCVSMCAKEMNRGVSECATTTMTECK